MSGAGGSSKGGSGQQMTFLPEDFQPGDDDVICGRGKKCYNHVGNGRFRERVTSMLDEYSKAKSKLDKSGVLATLVDRIRAASPGGGFVKQDEKGRWYEVGDFLAREKTSQAFRDALHERYKSSNVAKKKRRQEEQAKASDKFRRIARSYSDGVGSQLEWLSLNENNDIGSGFNMGSDPRYGMLRGSARMDDHAAAARFQSLAEMRHRLHRRFGNQGGGGGGGSGGRRSQPVSRPGSAMDNRYSPDPLFGDSIDGRNGFPEAPRSSFNRGMTELSASRSMAERNARSVPSSPLTSSRDLCFGADEIDPLQLPGCSDFDRYGEEEEMLHHSMPNIASSSDWGDMFDTGGSSEQQALHHSAPDLMFNEGMGIDDSISDLEPIPLTEITPRPASKKSISGGGFKKAISMTLSPTSPSAEAVSRDLLACLEKLTGSSIKSDNPFDQLPLGHEEEEELEEVVDEEPLECDQVVSSSAGGYEELDLMFEGGK